LSHSSRANTLFHFCKGGMDTLKSILKNGFFPRYSLENISIISRLDNTSIAFPLVSFCDIPIGRLKQHNKFYGYHGIGMDKNWGLGHKLNPVVYINSDTTLSKSFKTAFKGAITLNKNHGDSEYLESMRKIAAYIKPLSGKAKTIEGENKNKEFYHENEWRYIPINKNIQPYILEKDYKRDEDRLNKIAEEKASLKWQPNNIRYILVRNDFDASDLIDFIDHNINIILPDTPLREYWKKLLLTKVVILEEILEDI